ncbi:E3 ubiquitin-protein ligase synoviolin B-like [Carica papaya]|uniref:E3 ubiquitin-protein ligase synoviolin B-like n=1 Tax=Carica papaya TaxID=3649 RepID=UPI000B8D1692|nr:E3 ubiquitin-protein ligase synoviolin B-like [Carica papaya]
MDPRRLNLKLKATYFTPESQAQTLRVHFRLTNVLETLINRMHGAYNLQDTRMLSPTTIFNFDLPYFDRLSPLSAHWYILSILSGHRIDQQFCNHIATEILSMAKEIFSIVGGLGVFIVAEAKTVSTRVIHEFDEILARIDNMVLNQWSEYNDGGASASFLFRLREERRLDGEATNDRELGDCTVCLDQLSGAKELIDMPCHHVFHEACILRWLETKNSCPLCRQVPDTELLPGSPPAIA